MSLVTNKKGRPFPSVTLCRGYTLVELLLALFIFSLVVALVYATYRVTFSLIQGSEHQAALAEQSGLLLSQLTDDLESLILGDDAFFQGEEQTFNGGRMDRLVFLSSSHIALEKDEIPRGRTVVGYSAEVDQQSGLLALYRSETEVLPGVKTGEGLTQKNLFFRGLKELRFNYYDAAGNILTAWNSDAIERDNDLESPAFPVMVGVELVFPDLSATSKVQVVGAKVALLPER
jgi:prepilin-type N-terminal cleavage/methylation domain-containing protein